jgi:hypothetical protein
VFIEGCPGFSDDAAYRAMDFLPGALEEIAAEIFYSVAHLLNLDAGIVFAGTTSTYWELEVAAELAEVAGPARTTACPNRRARGCPGTSRTTGTTCRRW